jgi:uncharacterized membrane protein
LKNADFTEKVVFSVGLSVAFLMIIGLFLDLIAPLGGFNDPLSTNLIVISISLILLPLSLVSSYDEETFKIKLAGPRIFFLVALSIILLVLGIAGIMIVNASGNNILLLLSIISISLIIGVACASEKLIPPRFYPWILILSCVVLLFFVSNVTSLLTNYILGSDQWGEFAAFRFTNMLSSWSPTGITFPFFVDLPTSSMLSVTVLPTIFEKITGFNSSWLFKILYPSVACFLGLGTYVLYRTQTEKKVAFLAAFFFITVSVGKLWGTDKQLIAELFFVLLFLLIFNKRLPRLKKDILFIIFSAGLVVSHYGLADIFMIVIVSTWVILTLTDYLKKGSFSILQTKIPFDLVLIYLTMIFGWDIYVGSSSVFGLLSQTANTVITNLNQFFNLQSRGTALQGIGIIATPNILNRLSTYLFLFTELLIVLGFVWIVIRKKRTGFTFEYKIISALFLAMISLNIILPRLADTLLMSRYYQTTLFVLSPLAIIGGKTILEHIPKIKIKPKYFFPILAFLIFIPFFLFQTGFVYEVTGEQNYSQTLDMHQWDSLRLYDNFANPKEVSGAIWLSEYLNGSSISNVLTDSRSFSFLVGYGPIGLRYWSLLTSETTGSLGNNQFLYLSPENVINGKLEGGDNINYTQISPILGSTNHIYSNGGCEVYEGVL